jgi:hypothetical protein
MTEQERDEKIVGILTKICINVLVKNLFDKNGDTVIQDMLTELNTVPVAEEKEYTRCNSSHRFLHKTAMEYLQKTLAFKEKNNLK